MQQGVLSLSADDVSGSSALNASSEKPSSFTQASPTTRRRRKTFVLPEPNAGFLTGPPAGQSRSQRQSLASSIMSNDSEQLIPDTVESRPSINQFVINGVLGQAAWPLWAAFMLLRRKRRLVVFPLGTMWYCAPLMWMLALGCVVAVFLLPQSARTVDYLSDTPPHLRSGVDTTNSSTRNASLAPAVVSHPQHDVSAAEFVLALGMYLVTMVAASISLSHDPDTHRSSSQAAVSAMADHIRRVRVQKRKKRASANLSKAPPAKDSDDSDAEMNRLSDGEGGESAEAARQREAVIGHYAHHVPYDVVIFDEVPPLPPSRCLHFIYGGADWFRFNRSFENEHFCDDPPYFSYRCGEILMRNGTRPEEIVDFGGEIGKVDAGDVVEISDRMWNDDGVAVYAAEGGRPGLFLPIEGLFEIAMQSAAHSNDIMIGSEGILHGISRRKRLMRAYLGNGVFASSKQPSPTAASTRLLFLLISALYAALPILIRLLKRRPSSVGHTDSAGELLGVCASLALNFLCSMALLTVCRVTTVSLNNMFDAMRAFNRLTLGARPNRWYPMLNLLDPLNVQAWHFIAVHIATVHKVTMSMRVLVSCWLALCGCIAAGVAAATFTTLDFVSFTGCGLQVLIFAGAAGALACNHFYIAAEINDMCHVDQLAVVSLRKVSVDEELSLTAARSEEDVATLNHVRALLADIAFALETGDVPIAPGNLVVQPWVFRLQLLLQVAVVLPVVSIIVGFFVNSSKWGAEVGDV